MSALAKLTALVGYTDSGYLDAHFDLNAGHDDIARAVYAEIRGERDAEIIAWLGKKAAEYRAAGSRDQKLQANAIDTMASKIWRGAVRPNNVLGVVTRASVLREITDRLARRATLYGDSRTVNEVMRDLDRLATEADAGTGTAPSGETTQAADFFQPGHTYTRQHHGDRIEFYVEHIASAPSGRLRIAFGWRTGPDGAEEPSDSDDLDGWTDVTEAGEGR